MAENNNATVAKNIREGLSLANAFVIPNKVVQSIQPIFDVGNYNAIVLGYDQIVNASSAVLRTTSSTKRTFLTGAYLAVIKDALNTGTLIYLECTVGGRVVRPLAIPAITLTAQNMNVSLTLSKPIELDKNTTVTIFSSSAVANINVAGTIFGYEVETQ